MNGGFGRTLLLVAARDLRGRLRDRSALAIGVVAPVALAVIISLAIGGDGGGFEVVLGLADLDGGPIAGVLRDDVLGGEGLADLVTVVPFDDVAALESALEHFDVGVGLVLHPGMARLEVLRHPRAPIGGEVIEGVARSFAAQATGVQQAVVLATRYVVVGPRALNDPDAARVPFRIGEIGELAEQVAASPLPLRLRDASSGSSDRSAASYFGPGMALLFVFFLLGSAPRSLLAERALGTLDRVRAAPVPFGAIVLGKALAVMLMGLTSMGVVWGVTAVAFGARWGAPLAVLALMLAFLLAALAIATLVSAYVRTESQADGLITVVAFVLAMLGGNFVPIAQMPEALQQLALVTPNGWALRGFTTLAADGGGVGSILLPLSAILAFAVAAFTLAIPGLKRQVAS
jgi:ABC-2 type transport system permease protein